MLKDRLYTIDRKSHQNGILDIWIHFNPSDPIFRGHFPGQPVVPGVCLVAIISEITSIFTGSPLIIREASQIKFLKPVDPGNQPEAQVKVMLGKMENNTYHTMATIQSGEEVYMKFKGILEIED